MPFYSLKETLVFKAYNYHLEKDEEITVYMSIISLPQRVDLWIPEEVIWNTATSVVTSELSFVCFFLARSLNLVEIIYK